MALSVRRALNRDLAGVTVAIQGVGHVGAYLESVNGAVMGRCRAKQDLVGDSDRRRVISLLVHGDAAVQGQGVVAREDDV